jgi:uncharacterized protein
MVKKFDKDVYREDADLRSLTVTKDLNGFLKGPCLLTRTGVLMYRNLDGSIRRELRHPDEVLKPESLETLKLLPVINEHPTNGTGLVTPETAKELSIGSTGENTFTENIDGQIFLGQNIVISDKSGIEAVENGKKGLSLAYVYDRDWTPGVYNGESYDLVQRNIRYNHLALTKSGRAGSLVRVNNDSNMEDLMQERVCKTCGKKFNVEETSDATSCDACLKRAKNHDSQGSFMKLIIGGKEYEVDQVVGDHIDALDKQIASNAKLLDAAIARYDALNSARQSTANDSTNLDALVDEKLELLAVAKDHLDQAAYDVVRRKPLIDIRKAIVSKLTNGKVNCDGKSEDYLSAFIDSYMAVSGGRQAALIASDAQGFDSTDLEDAARKRMIERTMNASKSKEN